jgi:uncharacterized protein (DUF885 family)
MSSPIYDLCDTYIERLASLDPTMATQRGLVGHDDELTDYSPEGIAYRTDLDRSTLRALPAVPLQSDRDRVAAALLSEWLASRIASDETGETARTLCVLGTPWQSTRQVFDLMPHESAEDWERVAARLERLPASLEGLRTSLGESARRGMGPARRQVLACAEQGATWAGERGRPSYFTGLAAGYTGDDSGLRRRLEAAAISAAAAYEVAGDWMREELAPVAVERDAVGPDRYALTSRQHLGATVDPQETYGWGWAELHRIEAEMAQEAARIRSGATLDEVIDLLETDPERAIEGEDALRAFLQDLLDGTIAELDGTHFDIPAPLRRVEAMIAPPGGAAAQYYTGPSEDLQQPGRTWYPTQGRSVFPVWGEVSTCYHEGVPGHHLQIGQVRYLKEQLSRFQRTVWFAGHGEGWALYAERLMDELGYLTTPDHRLGFLRGQLLRAVRVIVDIGMHLELRIPAGEGDHAGETWTPELGREFLFSRARHPRDFLASELDRYLGRPGQAIAYKVGERAWLAAREQARQRLGGHFALKEFHAAALDLGPLGLDQLASECDRWSARARGAEAETA